MIIEYYPNPDKKKPHYVGNVIQEQPRRDYTMSVQGQQYSPFQLHQAMRKKITPMEWVRRDKIVRDAAAAATYGKGSLVYPFTKGKYDEHGQCRVIGICNSYVDFPDDEEWPTSDFPFIVLAQPLKTGQGSINATVGFFRTTPPTE